MRPPSLQPSRPPALPGPASLLPAQAGLSALFQGAALIAWSAEYLVDAAQRTVLFWDVLRRRGNQYFEHKAMPVPHVLSFEARLVHDARAFEPPVNYLLVEVLPPEGVVLDQRKRPFVVVDPRAGHGPGIGGFKADSELGMALRAGHPCYFVGFTPDPEPGQTLEDIMRAEAMFLETVIERHPEADGKPCVIGNCQAGWAVMMLAATRPELFGPILVPGAPLSYWAGVIGRNPMRYAGGLLGGSWLTALTSDLGGGTFDGAHLVSNFESLNPANTFWTKGYTVWSRIDTEPERFLEFEKWWGGHVSLNAEEMQWIVDQLFIGNRLATAEIVTGDGVRIDLRSIRSPIICFCSEGDDITPPQQALGWITDLYGSDADIAACGQTIVYSVHASIGHLGIFVSGSVARKEHQELTTNIDLIDVLPPGLYEAVLIPKAEARAGADMVRGEWISRFEPRTLDDVRAIVRPSLDDERRFAAVRRVSEINLGVYRTLAQPFVRAMVGQLDLAHRLHGLQPAELPHQIFSDRNPLMALIAGMAEPIRAGRRPAAPDNPWREAQALLSSQVTAALDSWKLLRDHAQEQLFLAIYSQPLLQALLGLRADDAAPRRRPGLEPEEIEFARKRMAEIRAGLDEGTPRDAFIRALLYIGMAGPGADERAFEMLNRLRAEHAPDVTLAAFKAMVRTQSLALTVDRDAAVAALPAMLPDDPAARERMAKGLRGIITAVGTPEGTRARRLDEIEALLAGPARAA